ncbi:MAG: class II fructose-bisphosphatase [Acidimicrobiales bacterium]
MTGSATGGFASLDRTLGSELARATEAGALAAARWIGSGDKEAADGAAVEAMRLLLNTVAMRGVVVIGEGEKDEAPMLYNGEELGRGEGPEVDIAVDPVEGTTLTSLGRPNAVSVIAASPRGSMFDPGPCFYMNKLAVGPASVGRVDINRTPTENIHAVAEATGKKPWEMLVVVLDRPRHTDLIAEIRAAGARVRMIPDGDVAGAMSPAWPDSGVDAMFGIGGTPEGVIAAAALKCMGGELQARLHPRNDGERQAIIDAGIDPDRSLGTNDLVAGDDCFFSATGITDGELAPGVRYDSTHATTTTLVIRAASGTIRRVTTRFPLGHSRVV